jgi:uncharacterized protein
VSDARRPSRLRRRLVSAVSLATVGVAAGSLYRMWPEQGWRNLCLATLPPELARHAVVEEAWSGLDAGRVWDMHTHLVGAGDSASGIYLNPELTKPANPRLYAQFLFYLNAGCVHEAPGRIDATYVARLRNLLAGMRPGFKAMLYAFDAAVDDAGNELREQTMFAVPDAYAASVATRSPDSFEWVASIHPYRRDALQRLAWAAANGARAVKWLPNAMLIDPAAPRCDGFYAALAALDLPLVTHAGHEAAVHSPLGQRFGNPLRLRRALDAGVRVVVAHCASLGEDEDLDRGESAPPRASFELFVRLMEEPRYVGRLFADISALAQRNRAGPPLAAMLERDEWHERLLNGSDYPLPGILPLFSVDALVAQGFLDARVAPVVKAIREHNPLLFDFVLKRHLRSRGRGFAARVFETRAFFDASLRRGGGVARGGAN